MTSYNLVCPFLTDDPTFAFGVEFGLLFARMGGRRRQDRRLLLPGKSGPHPALGEPAWLVRANDQPWGRDWFWCEIERQEAPAV